MPAFARTIGIDYSGAQTPASSLKGLRVYLARFDVALAEVHPPPSPREYWMRHGPRNGWLRSPRRATPHINDLAEFRPITVIMENRLSQSINGLT